MKKLFRFFALSLRRHLKSPGFLLVLILFPLLAFALDQVAIDSARNPLQVMIWCDDPDEMTENIFDTLTHLDLSVNFTEADTREEAEQAVISGKAECAYLFPDDLWERFEDDDENGSITLLASPSSTLYLMTREMVFAAINRERAMDLAEEFFLENHIYDDVADDLIAAMPEALTHHTGDFAIDIHLTMKTLANNAIETDGEGALVYRIPVRALGGVVLFLMAIFAAALVPDEKQSGITLCVPLPTRHLAAPVSILSVLLPAGASILAADLLCTRGDIGQALRLLLALAVYLLLLTAVAWLMAVIIKRSAILYFLMPVLTMASLLLCPIFFNLGQLLLPVRWLQYFLPPTWYLTVFSGGLLTSLLSLFLTAVLGGAAWLIERRQ